MCSRFDMTSSRSSGFTLIEVVVSLVILTTCAAALMYSTTISTSGNTRSKDEAVALALAVERMEMVKRAGWPLPNPGRYYEGTFAADGTASATGTYTRWYEVSSEDDGQFIVAGSPGAVINVYVSWEGGGYVVLSTMVVRPNKAATGFPVAYVRSWKQTR